MSGKLIKDYTSHYSDLVSFQSNKYFPIHRWFNLVEGYSPEFVRRLMGEQSIMPDTVLDPFGGVATTALACQDLGIKCHSFETNPFFFHVAKAKLRTDYEATEFARCLDKTERSLKLSRKSHVFPKLESSTFFENDSLNKWIFDEDTGNGILDILGLIRRMPEEDSKYADLCLIALASILVPISNVFRNGKCLSYKADWKSKQVTRKEVHEKFLEVTKVILIDIRSRERLSPKVYNFVNFKHGDSRLRLQEIEDESVNMVITSPPYLNSRDYTDVYRLELWILGFIKSYEEERSLRKDALTSHVQIALPDKGFPAVKGIEQYISHLNSLNGSLWNKNIPNMVKGYFNDMDGIFEVLSRKVQPGGMIYLNVSNSSYGKKIIEVDSLLAQVAKIHGFKLIEIRTARFISSSTQQNLGGKIRESVIVLRNER